MPSGIPPEISSGSKRFLFEFLLDFILVYLIELLLFFFLEILNKNSPESSSIPSEFPSKTLGKTLEEFPEKNISEAFLLESSKKFLLHLKFCLDLQQLAFFQSCLFFSQEFFKDFQRIYLLIFVNEFTPGFHKEKFSAISSHVSSGIPPRKSTSLDEFKSQGHLFEPSIVFFFLGFLQKILRACFLQILL